MTHKASFYEKYIKRLLDVVLSGIALIILSPVLLVTAILVRTKLGSPVLFRQERPGKDERIFKLCKFRTMTDARDENGELLPDEKNEISHRAVATELFAKKFCRVLEIQELKN